MAELKDITVNLKKQEAPKETPLTGEYRNKFTEQPKDTRKFDTSFPHSHGLATAEHKKALGPKPEEEKK